MNESHRLPGEDFQRTLEAARKGDEDALQALFSTFYTRVESMVHAQLSRDLRRHRPWLLARFSTGDVVQEVFRSVLEDLSDFRGQDEDAFCGYLAMVVRNRLLDALRHHQAAQRDGRRSTTPLEERDPTFHGSDPAAEAAAEEEREVYRQALASLDPRSQELLRARLSGGLSFDRLAEELGYTSRDAARRAFYAAQAELALRFREGRS